MKALIYIFILLTPLLGSSNDLDRLIDLRGFWKFSIGDRPEWADPTYNDENWEEIFTPSRWEDEGFSGFDGYAWYRKKVDLSNIKERSLFLVLGYIDDVDEVYFNGHLIGFSGSFPPNFYTAYNSHREYFIPEEWINASGENTIAVRVYDAVLDGGIMEGKIGIYTDGKSLPETLVLDGVWKFREGDNRWWKEIEYDDKRWQEIMVPGFWRNLKMTHIEGEAWYRKTFVLPEDLKNAEHLVLVLGKVDDFDDTYLNGVLIGSTNDGKPFGDSRSYEKFRVYHIPESALNRNGQNVLAVHVYDIGIDAGIYEGPVQITTEDRYKKQNWTWNLDY